MILDTNALSAFADGDGALKPIVATKPRLYLPVIVLGEYQFGIRFSRQQKSYETWLARHLPDFHVLLVDEHTSTVYADIRTELKAAGTPIPENDIWIAATARQHGFEIASRDTHFEHVRGLRRISW